MREADRPLELEAARAVLRALEPPLGAKERVARVLAREQQPAHKKKIVIWGLPLGIFALAAAAAAAEDSSFWRFGSWGRVAEAVDVQAPSMPSAPRPMTRGDLPAQAPEARVEPSAVTELSARPTAEEGQLSSGNEAAGASLPAKASNAAVTNSERLRTTSAAVSKRGAGPQTLEGPRRAADELPVVVREYERARALAERDPRAGLAAFQGIRKRWPHGALAAEVDLQIVRLLGVLGERKASAAEARDFAQKYPGSPQARQVRDVLLAPKSGQ